MPGFKTTKGWWLNYEVVGADKAAVLVLLHANPFDHRMWLYQMAHLSQHCRVVALDFPGYGKSGPAGDKVMSMADLTDAVRGIYRQLGVDTAIVGGLSVGAQVAKQFAVDYQPCVKALILAGCGGGTVRREAMDERIAGYRRLGLAYRADHIQSLVSKEFAASILGRYLISMFLETGATTDVESIVSICEALKGFNVENRLSQIKVPTLIVHGEWDRALAGSLDLHRAIAGSEYKIIKGAGHACALEKPWEFDSLVLEFLKDRGVLAS